MVLSLHVTIVCPIEARWRDRSAMLRSAALLSVLLRVSWHRPSA